MKGVIRVDVVDESFHMDLPFLSIYFHLHTHFHLSVYFRLPCHTTGGLVRRLRSASPANVPLMSVVGPSRRASALS